jgi:hypothetical protein
LNQYRYKNESIYAENRWTAWLMAMKIYKEEDVVLKYVTLN